MRWGMPAVAGGDLRPGHADEDIEFDGELRYASTLHGFDYSLVDPQVVLDGANSKLYASGVKVEGTTSGTFDRSQPVFDLDLSAGRRSPSTQITRHRAEHRDRRLGLPRPPTRSGRDRTAIRTRSAASR